MSGGTLNTEPMRRAVRDANIANERADKVARRIVRRNERRAAAQERITAALLAELAEKVGAME